MDYCHDIGRSSVMRCKNVTVFTIISASSKNSPHFVLTAPNTSSHQETMEMITEPIKVVRRDGNRLRKRWCPVPDKK